MKGEEGACWFKVIQLGSRALTLFSEGLLCAWPPGGREAKLLSPEFLITRRFLNPLCAGQGSAGRQGAETPQESGV